MTPEMIKQAITHIHAALGNIVDALRGLADMSKIQEARIAGLEDRVKSLEENRAYVNEQQYLKELDIADGKWYREANDLG